ncbi:MAG: addiction module protein [Flavobacteriales bacterium]|nr:addiction module protein [Flavobacteriales bacterium]
MAASKIKSDISKILERINDERFLNSVLVMMRSYDDSEPQLSTEQLNELERRIVNHRNGETDSIPWRKSLEEIRAKVRK